MPEEAVGVKITVGGWRRNVLISVLMCGGGMTVIILLFNVVAKWLLPRVNETRQA